MIVSKSLPPTLRDFLLSVRRIQYGRMEGVVIRGGIPVDDPPPAIFREHKFCSERRRLYSPDLALYCQKPQVFELIREMADLGEGKISCLEIQNGLPFRMLICG